MTKSGQRLLSASGRPESIRFSHHANDFQAAADKLSEQSRLSLDEVPALDDILAECHSAAAHRQRNGLPPAVPEMEDSILIAAAAGRVDLVAVGPRLAPGLAGTWDRSRLPLDWPGTAKWLDDLALKAEDAEALSALVESQVAQHKLAKIRSVQQLGA